MHSNPGALQRLHAGDVQTCEVQCTYVHKYVVAVKLSIRLGFDFARVIAWGRSGFEHASPSVDKFVSTRHCVVPRR